MTPLPVTHVPDRRRVSSLLAATGTEVSPSLCAFVLLSAAQGDTDGCIRLLEVTDILPSQATMPAPAAVTCSHSGDPLTVLRIACSIPSPGQLGKPSAFGAQVSVQLPDRQ